jgi:hypothetical protein
MSRLAQALISLTFLLSSVPVQAQLFFHNLFENSGAEAGPASPDGQTVVPVPGWMTSGNFTVVGYGTPGEFPTATDPGPPNRGSNFFAGGPNNASSTASQMYEASPQDASEIDVGHVFYTMEGYLGGFANEQDHAMVAVIYKNAQGEILSSATIGPVTAADRNNRTGLLVDHVNGSVPVGTRRVELILTMTRIDGSYNNAFADGLSIVLISPLPVDPSTWGRIKASYRH